MKLHAKQHPSPLDTPVIGTSSGIRTHFPGLKGRKSYL